MKKINFEKDLLPHLLAVVIFFIIVFIFYHPAFLEGKRISQHDILMAKGASQVLEEYREETGEEGLWALTIFSGMPAYLVNVNWSGDLFRFFYQLSYLNLPSPARLTFPAMVAFYILLLAFGVRPYLAIGGAIAYALSSFNIIGIVAGHNLKILAIAYMPMVIAGIHLTFRGKYTWGFLLTLIGLYLQIRVNHLQITYYLLIIVLIYGIYQLWDSYRNNRLKSFFKTVAILLAVPVLVIGINFGKIWSVYSYSEYTIRGPSELTAEGEVEEGLSREYAFNYSYGIFEPLTLLIPNFMGGSSVQELDRNSALGDFLQRNNVPRNQQAQVLESARTYWGDQPFIAGPYYAGATIIFLFVLGIFFTSGYVKRWLITVVIVSIVLSWGSNFETFNNFMFDFFPGYNKFRSVTFTIIMAIFAMPLLGMLGLNNLAGEPQGKEKRKKLLLSAGITGGFCLLLILIAGMLNYNAPVDSQLPEWMVEPLREDRENLLRNDAFRSLIFIALLAVTLFFFIRNRIGTLTVAIISSLLILADLWFVDKRYLNEQDFVKDPVKSYFAPTPADQRIMNDDSDYRVLNLIDPFNEGRTSYFHQSIGGYHGAKLRRYQDLIERPMSNDINQVINQIRNSGDDFSGMGVLNMLNTRYFKAGSSADAVFENPAANGSAWFVRRINTVNNPDEELAMLTEMDTKNEAVIDRSKFEVSRTAFDTTGSVDLEIKTLPYLKYRTENQQAGFLVLSEIFYPEGWEATINGETAEIKRVNYVLRGLEVPAGENTIELFFRPRVYFTGNRIMWWFSILTYLVIAGLLIRKFRMRA